MRLPCAIEPEPEVHFALASLYFDSGSLTLAEVELDKVPYCPELDSLDDARRLQIALATGDDYELCFTLDRASEDEMNRRLEEVDCSVTCIGRITEAEGIRWLDENAGEVTLDLEGYQHF